VHVHAHVLDPGARGWNDKFGVPAVSVPDVLRVATTTYNPSALIVVEPDWVAVPKWADGLMFRALSSKGAVATAEALRQVHAAGRWACGQTARANHSGQLILKSRPDVLLDSHALAHAVDRATAWLATSSSDLLFIGCVHGAGPDEQVAGVSDVMYLTTPQVFDRLGSFDLLSCMESLRAKEAAGGPKVGLWVNVCLLRWLRAEGVEVWPLDGVFGILRPSGGVSRAGCHVPPAYAHHKRPRPRRLPDWVCDGHTWACDAKH